MRMLQERMENIVDDYTLFFKEDFLKDLEILESDPDGSFLWIVRTTGTYLLPIAEVLCEGTFCYHCIHYYMDTDDSCRFYLIWHHEIREITKESLGCLNKLTVSSNIEYEFEDGTQYSINKAEVCPLWMYTEHGSLSKEKVVPADKKLLKRNVHSLLKEAF